MVAGHYHRYLFGHARLGDGNGSGLPETRGWSNMSQKSAAIWGMPALSEGAAMAVSLGALEYVDPHKIWINEPAGFTPWLAENLGRLGEALGLDLELLQMESSVGDFSCDIEAREAGTNRPVIIENQLDPTNHTHLGQLLTYAAGLDAAVVVWISPQFRDEHRQAIDWLNRHTDDQIDFFGIALEVLQIDDSKPAVQLRPVAFPNTAKAPPVAASETGATYQRFYQPLVDELREKHRFTNARAAQPANWISFTSGTPRIGYNASFGKGGRLRAEVYVDIGNKAGNKAIFDSLHTEREAIEREMGEKLVWERLDNKRASRISAALDNASVENADTKGDELRSWLINHLLKIKSVFGKRIAQAAESVQANLATEPIPVVASE